MRYRTALTGILLAAAVAGMPGCNWLGTADEVPPQSYMNPLQILGGNAGSLRGQVLFPSEYSQRSVTVLVDEYPFVTHPDGRFRIEWIPPGSHHLAVRVKGFEPVEQSFALAPDGDLQLKPLRLTMARGKVIGRLVDENGKSASDITLRLAPLGGVTASDQDGIFQFIGVHSGEHKLFVEDSDFVATIGPFAMKPGELRNLGLIHVERRHRAAPGPLSLNGKSP